MEFPDYNEGDRFTSFVTDAPVDPPFEIDPVQTAPAAVPPPADTDVPMPPVDSPPPLPAMGTVILASPPCTSTTGGARAFGDIGDKDTTEMDLDVEDSLTSGDDLRTKLEQLKTESKCFFHLIIIY